MRRFTRTLATLAVLAALAGTLEAQAPAPIRFGTQVSYNFDAELVGIGVRLEHSLGAVLGSPQIHGLAEANWFPGGIDIFDLNYNVIYRFSSPQVKPYAGGGLAFLIASGAGQTNSDLHLNALGGVEFRPLGLITPFVQLRYVFAGGGDALILGGGFFF